MQLTRDYEISLWEEKGGKEVKIGIIGSNEMSSPNRAQNPVLTRNTNGTKKLEFYLFFEYVDEIEGRIKRNLFCPLLSNGRKLKLKWKDKWYEFIITNIVESSENKKITYVAQDATILDLSRKGFNIELSTDLENNQGTIFQLTEQIIKNTEWTLDEENSLISPQTLDDVLVELEVTEEIKVKRKTFLDSNGLLTTEEVDLIVPIGEKIYTFYSIINNEDSFFQFYYSENPYKFNEDGFIFDCPLYLIEDYKYIEETPNKTKKLQTISNKGKKLIRSQRTGYNEVLDTYVKYYKTEDQIIVGFTETEYLTDDFTTNLITNDKDFITNVGWYALSDNTFIETYNYPDAEIALELLKTNSDIETQSYLQINTDELNKWSFYNTGPNDNKDVLGNLYNGKKFVIRLKYNYLKNKTLVGELKSPPYNKTKKRLKTGFEVALCTYTFDDEGTPIINDILLTANLTGSNNVFEKDGEYWTAICENTSTYTKEDLLELNLGLFFRYADTEDLRLSTKSLSQCYFYLEDCQFFEYKPKTQEDETETYYLPGDIIESESKIKYNYFLEEENKKITSKDQIQFLYCGYKQKDYEKDYYSDFPQVRTIEQKESNIFNLIQTLCENFDCWADFIIEHDENGYVKKNNAGKVIKKIRYRPYIGKENWSGYRRGINLKKVERTLDSTQITTKTIVKPNSNEFAPNGFCTIAYSSENPSGENFIYDFSHYISKGLIEPYQLHQELYGTNGLYKTLRQFNDTNQKLTDTRVALAQSIIYNEKEKQVYSALVSELSSSIAENKRNFRLYSGITYQKFLKLSDTNKKETLELSGVNNTFVRILSEQTQLKKAKVKLEEVSAAYSRDFDEYNKIKDKIKLNAEQKEKAILNFESKYSNYIQEGVWISEECIDHDLYYIEAKSIATTSSIPKISYNIDVVDISSLEEFFNYNVDIGDKTYVIDPEFFGYLNEFAIKTPKKQEVVITELVEDLENPEKNKTTVQSYKTQFDDLFSRITATAQQLQLNEGAYNRAAGAFSNYGLDTTYTQNSLNNSNFLLQNNTIKWNVDGFVTTNTLNKHQFIKIHNGSICLTDDGGATWNTAISGKGINANYMYAGQLDAGKVNIVSELKVSDDQELQYCLTMDKDGLSMYSFDEATKITRVRLGKIVSDIINGEEQFEEDLYGLQLYNNQGVQTFRTDSNGDITMTGTIYAKDGYFKGAVVASRGEIGGWIIEENQLNHKSGDEIDAIISSSELTQNYQVNGKLTNDWRLLFGIENSRGKFGVTGNGSLYANGVDIKDGNISFGDLFKITSNGTGSAVTYGLNINLSPENEKENIVIESEERVIGIREKETDDMGRVNWIWKTVIGDLSKVTIGGQDNKQKLSDLGVTGYGICTDNGFFSGYVVAGAGQIGGFVIGEDNIYTRELVEFKTEEEVVALNFNNSGIYLDNNGNAYFGNVKNFVKLGNFNSKGEVDPTAPYSIEIGINHFTDVNGVEHGVFINKDGLSIDLTQENSQNVKTIINDNGLVVSKLKENSNSEEIILSAQKDRISANSFEVKNFIVMAGSEFIQQDGRTVCYYRD